MNRPEIQILPLRGAIPLGETSRLEVVVRIVPPEPTAQDGAPRQDLNLALVIDRSGSMSGGKLDLAREAAASLVARLRPCDRISVVAFDDRVEALWPGAPARDLQAVQQVLRRLTPRGQTALHEGWREGARQVSHHLEAQAVNRVLLLTDGQANVGEGRPEVLADQAGELAARGISTTTFGIGAGYHEELLSAMARKGDGNFYHVAGPDQFQAFFDLELDGLSRTVGRKVSLGLEPAPGVRLEVRNHLERTSTGRFCLPNLLCGVPIEVVVRATVEGPEAEGERPILRVRLAWDPAEGPRQVQRQGLSLPAVNRGRLEEFPLDPQVFGWVTLMEIARLKRRAAEHLRQGDRYKAQEKLERARELAGRIPPSPARDAELEDVEYLRLHLGRGNFEEAQKASYFQHEQRSHGRSHYSSGRESRHREF